MRGVGKGKKKKFFIKLYLSKGVPKMDAILKRMQANKKSDAEQTMIHPELLRVHEEEISRRNELIQYRERAIRHLKKLMEGLFLPFFFFCFLSFF